MIRLAFNSRSLRLSDLIFFIHASFLVTLAYPAPVMLPGPLRLPLSFFSRIIFALDLLTPFSGRESMIFS